MRAQREISSKEFGEWIAFESTSPGYPERGDLQAALVSCSIARFSGAKKKYNINDFLLKFGGPVRKSIEELKVKFTFWKSMMNASNKMKQKKKKK